MIRLYRFTTGEDVIGTPVEEGDPLQEGGSGYKKDDIVYIGGGKYCKVNDVTGETENYKYILFYDKFHIFYH